MKTIDGEVSSPARKRICIRRLCVGLAVSWSSVVSAQAQTDFNAPQASARSPELLARLPSEGAVPLTQSTDLATITAFNSISCNDQMTGFHADNSYYRRFLLNLDHGLSGSVNFATVSFGVETAVSATGLGQPITVNLYAIPAVAPFLLANLMPIGSTPVPLFPDQSLTKAAVDVAGNIPDATMYDLVVEIFSPNGQTAGHTFFIGSNANGQTQPSFIKSSPCSVNEPTDLAGLGFAGMHLVMSVNLSDAIFAHGFESGDTSSWSSSSP